MVEVVAGVAGIGADHVIGVRTRMSDDGILQLGYAPCGNSDEPIMTYDEGKLCFIREQIFGLRGSQVHASSDEFRRRRRLKTELFRQLYPALNLIFVYNCFVKRPNNSIAIEEHYILSFGLID